LGVLSDEANDPDLVDEMRSAIRDEDFNLEQLGNSGPQNAPQEAGYRILRRIGAGGMGLVFEAVQPRTQRRVALKVIQPGYATPGTLRRFQKEAEVLGRLIHTGIAQVYDAGSLPTPDGPQPFIAMELVDGDALNDHVAKSRLQLKQTLGLMIHICDAVEHAHQQGVMHRDLKPANILVTSEGMPKILDFGIARITADDFSTNSLQTQEGQILGTLPYMSPEQVRGERDAIDTRSDIYALGVILYELLAGKLPHDLSGKPITEAVRLITQAQPQSLAHFDSKLAGDLDNIVAKAMDHGKSRRYATVSDLAEDLRRFLNQEPVKARPASSIYLLRKFTQRNRVFVGAGLAIILALSIGMVTTLQQLSRALDAEQSEKEVSSQLRIEKAAASAEARKANTALLFLQSVIKQASPFSNWGEEASIQDALLSVRGMMEATLSNDPEVALAVDLAMAGTLLELGDYEQAQVHSLRVLEKLDRHEGEPARELLEAQLLHAEILVKLSENDQAIEFAKKTLENLDGGEVQFLPLRSNALKVVGVASYRQGLLDECMQALSEAVTLMENPFDDPFDELNRIDILAEVLNHLGLAAAQLGDLDGAMANYEKSIQLLTERYDNKYPGIGVIWLHIADVWRSRGRTEKVGESIEKAGDIYRESFGKEHIKYADYLESLSLYQSSINDLDGAILNAQSALAIRLNEFGDEHFLVGMAYHKLGLAQDAAGIHLDAQTSFTRAAAACKASVGAESYAHILCLRELANCLVHTKEFPLAIEKLDQAMKLSLIAFPADSPPIGELHWVRARTLLASSRHAEAADAFLQAAPIMEASYGPESAMFKACATELSKVYEEWGKPEEAGVWKIRAAGEKQ
jgi:eukaryotic-like serine/threonine-protein kinase